MATPLEPAPDPRAVLMGLALLREKGSDLVPFFLGGNLALYGEPVRPFVIIGWSPEEELGGDSRPTDEARFPWEDGAVPLLEAIERFVEGSEAGSPVCLAGGEVPFGGGVTVGWLGHELGASRLARHRAILLIELRGRTAWCVAPADGPHRGGGKLVREAERLGAGWLARHGPRPDRSVAELPRAWVRNDPAAYTPRVRTIQRHIAAGDVYQVNLSHTIHVPLRETGPVALTRTFLDLHAGNPVPFPAFVTVGDTTVLSLSPERYCARRGRWAESRPIKGTRPRGSFPEEDSRLARELVRSAKDRAENIMIVDLVRNDLGRVAEVGGVSVAALCELESFASVHHLVSTVRAHLRPGTGMAELLAAIHPAGSMTGAPKIKAVEILSRLEGEDRGPYAGGVGWFAGPSCFDLAMVIRSVVVRGETATLRVGGGVVADSDPDAEYQETLDKARSLAPVLTEAAEGCRGVRT